jgi:3',5'-cyclic AMP phosphodiesterase CpdA
MTNRRSILAGTGAAALLAQFQGFAAAQTPAAPGQPLFRFGLVSDPQYAPVPPNLVNGRYYANSLWKMQEAVATFNAQPDLRFVVTLGDIIDRHFESFAHILPVYDTLRHEKFFLLGNHDFEVGRESLHAVVRTVGMPRAYYDFAGGGFRFIMLDGNDVSLFAPPAGDARRELAAQRLKALKDRGAENAQSWNGSLGDEQFAWLEATLRRAREAGERVIVMNHYPVFPANMHNMWDSERIVALLTGQPHVVAFFNGHNHAGNYGEREGVHFMNFKGMVDTPTTTAYSIVSVHADRIEIQGFGREENRVLALRAKA